MDPKQNTQLDPKLAAVYNRVMETDTTIPHDPSQQTTPVNSPTPPPPADPGGIQLPNLSDTPPTMPNGLPNTPPVIPPTDTPPVPPAPAAASTPAQPIETTTPQVATTATVEMQATQPIAQVTTAVTPVDATEKPETVHITTSVHTTGEKKKVKISPVILILGGVVFLVAYALIWVKVFGLQLPFLPQ